MSIKTEKIEYQHDGKTLEGHLAFNDSNDGPRPGVLVSHAWAGRSDFECKNAERLAEEGYVGFALDLYGKGVLGSGPEENRALMHPLLEDRGKLRDRLLTALQTLAAHEQVDQNRIGIMGYCFGGLCALDMARANHPIKAAISLHGLLAAPEGIETTTVKSQVLVLHGWDDPMVPPEQVLAFSDEFTKAGADWQLHSYGGTMHAFTNPAANDPGFGTVYSSIADKRSWKASMDFLAEVFGDQ